MVTRQPEAHVAMMWPRVWRLLVQWCRGWDEMRLFRHTMRATWAAQRSARTRNLAICAEGREKLTVEERVPVCAGNLSVRRAVRGGLLAVFVAHVHPRKQDHEADQEHCDEEA